MKLAINIFRRAIVWDYYRKNALFLLVVILFAFGFLRGQEHIALGKQILGSSSMLLWVIFVWLLYGVKTYLFALRSLALPEFRFLFAIVQLRFWQRIGIWSLVVFLMNQLTFLYAFFLILLGFLTGKFMACFFIIMAQIVIVLFGVLVLEWRISKYPDSKLGMNFHLPLRFKFHLPFFLFFHKYLLEKEPVLFLLTKVFGILSVMFIIWLYPTDDYDSRLFSISAVVLAATQLQVASQWITFQFSYLQFYQNLPLSFKFRIGILTLSYFILLLPEILIVFVQAGSFMDTYYLFSWVFLVISLVVFSHYFQYQTYFTQDGKMQVYFFGIVSLLLVIMYKVPIIILALIFSVLSFYLLSKFERKFELK